MLYFIWKHVHTFLQIENVCFILKFPIYSFKNFVTLYKKHVILEKKKVIRNYRFCCINFHPTVHDILCVSYHEVLRKCNYIDDICNKTKCLQSKSVKDESMSKKLIHYLLLKLPTFLKIFQYIQDNFYTLF